ncbi:hypothetical protein BY458DRAFT_503344 [Sporodiniella umbellata]|nr:hypothetical protein BY458DRAFT_503344 [Sporodiniella umbellata]
MFNNSNHDWAFPNNNNSRHNSAYHEPLREPVAFEDFHFSLGLDPDFAMPIPLDIPPASSNPSSYLPPPPPPPLPASFPSESAGTSVLNEQDQKAFSHFLDQFYVDPNMQIDPQPFYFSSFEEEQARQANILHSLDQHKRYKEKAAPAYHPPPPPPLHPNRAIHSLYSAQENAESPKGHFLAESSPTHTNPSHRSIGSPGNHPTKSNHSTSGGGPIRRGKFNKELLTEEEKRNNHIASEQKRRGMIRTGFKDLTEIVPTLKNINNSKSTVLFKAVDYIRYLEKRNKNLREKIQTLEVRAEVEEHMGGRPSVPAAATSSSSSSTQAALLQHKSQQKQLYELQEKLQHHKKLLAPQNRFNPSTNSSSFWHNDNTKSEYEDIVSA